MCQVQEIVQIYSVYQQLFSLKPAGLKNMMLREHSWQNIKLMPGLPVFLFVFCVDLGQLGHRGGGGGGGGGGGERKM